MLPRLELFVESARGAQPLTVTRQSRQGREFVLGATLPELPDGAYTLHVRTGRQDLRAAKAVFVRRQWPQRIRLVQVADLPPPGRESLMRRFTELMRGQQPDAVLVTGDINYGGSESNINFVFGQLATLDMPVIMTAGNHERTGWHRYLRVFGARNHRTDLGPLTILSLDSAHGRDQLTASSFRWLEKELERSVGRGLIIQIHHPLFPPGPASNSEAGGTGGYLRGQRRAFLDLCRRFQVAIVLSGHWHQDAVFDAGGNFRTDRTDFPGTKFVVTTALGADARALYANSPVRNGYRWIEFIDGTLSSYGTDSRNPVPSTDLGTP